MTYSYNQKKWNERKGVTLEEIVGLIGGGALIVGALIACENFKDSKYDYTKNANTNYLYTNYSRSVK